MNFVLVAVAVLALLVLYGGFKVVTSPNVTHAAIALAITFIGVAGIYVTLSAPFLAFIQVLVYVGAIMTVVIFAIMLSEVREFAGERVGSFKRLLSPSFGLWPAATAAGFVVLVLGAYFQSPPGARGSVRLPLNDVAELGREIFSSYVVPLELASILLLASMVGAIVISRKGESE